MGSKEAVLKCLEDDPDDPLSWAALVDLLVAEEAPADVVLMARRGGLWRGTRADWEREGPRLVDAAPIKRLWLTDVAPNMRDGRWVFHLAWLMAPGNHRRLDGDDIPREWVSQPVNLHRSGEPDVFQRFNSLEEALDWLVKQAMEWARREKARHQAWFRSQTLLAARKGPEFKEPRSVILPGNI